MRDGTVIGEGVVLDLRVASFMVRTGAALIDVAALVLVFIAIAWVAGEQIGTVFTSNYGSAVLIAILALMMVGVPVLVETATRGRSLGKWALGTRVVRDDAGPVRVRHATARALVGVGELWLSLGSIAIIASLSNDRGKRLGDLIAGTYVVRVRAGAREKAPTGMPPYLAVWARSADVARLPDDVALATRTFLARVHQLAPGSRIRLADDLAARTTPFVSPGPPPGTPPELFLAAVIATRRERELASARRAQSLELERTRKVSSLPHEVPDAL